VGRTPDIDPNSPEIVAARERLVGDDVTRPQLKAILNKSDRTLDRLIARGMPRHYLDVERFNLPKVRAFLESLNQRRCNSPRGRGRPRRYEQPSETRAAPFKRKRGERRADSSGTP
jgi:hypothetical protein